jgi:hypothetical protein
MVILLVSDYLSDEQCSKEIQRFNTTEGANPSNAGQGHWVQG